MKRKKKKALILSVFMILLLAACSSRTNVRDGDDYIYCLNPDKTGLVKVSYEVQGEDVVEEAKDILREMQIAGRRDPVYTGYFQKDQSTGLQTQGKYPGC